jgi:hypothetical protein
MSGPQFPAEMVLPTAVVFGTSIGGLVFGCFLAWASRLAMRRRTLGDPHCSRCSIRIVPIDCALPSLCPECGASLAEPASARWASPPQLSFAKSVTIAVGLVIAGLVGLATGLAMRELARSRARSDLASTLAAQLARCELPGHEGARALRELSGRFGRGGLSVGEGVVFDRWLAAIDAERVAFGVERVADEPVDWLRAADFVDLIIIAIEHEATSTWRARQVIGEVMPLPRLAAPTRVRAGDPFFIISDAGLPTRRVAVQDAGLWIDGASATPLPGYRPVSPGRHERSVLAPGRPGRYALRRAWTIDVLSGTLSMPPRADAAPSGLPRRTQEEWTLEVVEGPETIALTLDPARDPFRAEGAAIAVDTITGERSTLIRWTGWPSAAIEPVGAWEIEVSQGADSAWIAFDNTSPVARTRTTLVDGDPLAGRDRIRIRYTPAESPTLPRDGAPERRSVREAFGLGRIYELVLFDEQLVRPSLVRRTYRLGLSADSARLAEAPAARERTDRVR